MYTVIVINDKYLSSFLGNVLKKEFIDPRQFHVMMTQVGALYLDKYNIFAGERLRVLYLEK